jgi:hypothetical protein
MSTILNLVLATHTKYNKLHPENSIEENYMTITDKLEKTISLSPIDLNEYDKMSLSIVKFSRGNPGVLVYLSTTIKNTPDLITFITGVCVEKRWDPVLLYVIWKKCDRDYNRSYQMIMDISILGNVKDNNIQNAVEKYTLTSA